MAISQSKQVFDQFVNLYPLSKTLRFELIPDSKTLEHMKNRFGYDPAIQAFLCDKDIEDAYKLLKPVFDAVHERFITDSLDSEMVKKINFEKYLGKYEKKDLNEKDDLTRIESELRKAIGEAFLNTAEMWKERAGTDEKGKPVFKEKGYKILTEKGILSFIRKNADTYSHIVDKNTLSDKLNKFKDFFTYFTGFNQNRENYYETTKEAETAVATRIIGTNLPKFCDNILAFRSRKKEYLDIYEHLLDDGVELVNNAKEKLHSINEKNFLISAFN